MIPHLVRLHLSLLVLAAAPILLPDRTAHGQTSIPVGIRFVGMEANSPPGACGCFWLKGAAADAAIPLHSRLAAAVEVAGVTAARIPASTRGLSEITLLAGPSYRLPVRRTILGIHALFGAVHGFDTNFGDEVNRADTSTNFAMALGGSAEVPLNRRLTLRAIQIDYVQTNLPNGLDNRQRNLRLGTGLVFRVPLPAPR